MMEPSRKSQAGQALIEHIILWPLLSFLVLSGIQLGLLYRDKATLNHAAFQAAREGALNHAFSDPMRRILLEAMLPVKMKGDASAAGYAAAVTANFASGFINPKTGAKVIDSMAIVDVDVISPNRDIFSKHARSMYTLIDDCGDPQKNNKGNDRSKCTERRYRQIPNDNLNIRPTNRQKVVVEGQDVEIDLQDANLIKIRAHYCAELSVPLVGKLMVMGSKALNALNDSFWDFYRRNGASSHRFWNNCRNRSIGSAAASSAGLSANKYYIPISSTAVVRMQSPVRCEGSEEAGNVNQCRNLR